MYDLDYSAPEARKFCEAGAEGCPWAVIGRGSKGAEADGGLPMYDGRCTIWEVSARCAEVRSGRRLAAPMYDVRFEKITHGQKGREGA